MSYILLVEDEALIAALMSKKIEDASHEKVVICKNLEQAVERLTEDLPKLAFLDVNIENEMCFGLASDLQLRGVPIFFMTSYSLQSLRNLGLPEHLDNVEIISKSTASQALLNIIRANTNSKPAEVSTAAPPFLRT